MKTKTEILNLWNDQDLCPDFKPVLDELVDNLETLQTRKIENKFMFTDFEQYAEIMKITKSHPYYEAFEMVWRMARTPPFADDQTQTKVI